MNLPSGELCPTEPIVKYPGYLPCAREWVNGRPESMGKVEGMGPVYPGKSRNYLLLATLRLLKLQEQKVRGSLD